MPGSSHKLRVPCPEGPEEPASLGICLDYGSFPLWFVAKVFVNEDPKVLDMLRLHHYLLQVLREEGDVILQGTVKTQPKE